LGCLLLAEELVAPLVDGGGEIIMVDRGDGVQFAQGEKGAEIEGIHIPFDILNIDITDQSYYNKAKSYKQQQVKKFRFEFK
jgi:hypothetical protein